MKNRVVSSAKLFAIILITILYLEILFKVRVLNFGFDITLLRIFIFSLSYSILAMFLMMFFREKTVKILMYILISLITFLYVNQEIYHSFVEGFYSLTIVGDFNAGLSFLGNYFSAFRFIHIFYALPIVSLILLNKFKYIDFNIEYYALKRPLILLITGTLIFFIGLQTIEETVDQNGDIITYSDMDLYTYMYNNQDALKKFGLLTYTQRDFFNLFRTDPLSESEYEILIREYFSTQPEHDENDYTGIFEDKNLILIMAESLDVYAINEELTPNLYKMKHENAYFENYYSPLYYRSTADTEFLVQTSMYPNKNVTLSMNAYTENTFPYTLPKLFSAAGYETLSFHNYIDYFYPRSSFHTEALGYDKYYGPTEMGMVVENADKSIIFGHDWQSDYDMMVAAVPEFIQMDKFFVNMLTVSGHFDYDNDHPIAQKNIDEVLEYQVRNDIVLDSQIRYYLAANIELDKAIGYLLDELDAVNKKKDTVIVIFGDHYAYGIDNDVIWDYEYEDAKEVDSKMDLHNVPLLIYSEESILNSTTHIDNYMSSIDMIPTLANLFNVADDCFQYFFGNDALANKKNIVRFADLSFVSSTFSYDSLSEEMNIPAEMNPTYISGLNNIFINDYKYNVLVLDYDYFKKDDEEEEE